MAKMQPALLVVFLVVVLVCGCLDTEIDTDIITIINQLEGGGTLIDDIGNSKTIMWIGPHPDDEVYMGGTMGYATRDLGKKLVIVSFDNNPLFYGMNKNSAKFFGNADYVRILRSNDSYKHIGGIGGDCYFTTIDDKVNALIDIGIKDRLVNLIEERRPDIIFTFEPSHGYSGSCEHAAGSLVTYKAIEDSSLNVTLYYVINRNPNFAKLLGGGMDPLPVTDIIELDDRMWEYRITAIDFYSPFYSSLAKRISSDEDKMVRKEFFRKVEFQSDVEDLWDGFIPLL